MKWSWKSFVLSSSGTGTTYLNKQSLLLFQSGKLVLGRVSPTYEIPNSGLADNEMGWDTI